MNISHDYSCPYCLQTNTASIDITAGKDQKWVSDCEVCCRPVLIQLRLDGENVESFSARQENE